MLANKSYEFIGIEKEYDRKNFKYIIQCKLLLFHKLLFRSPCIYLPPVQRRIQNFFHQVQISFLGEGRNIFIRGRISERKKRFCPLGIKARGGGAEYFITNKRLVLASAPYAMPPMSFFHQTIRGICPLFPTDRHAYVYLFTCLSNAGQRPL